MELQNPPDESETLVSSVHLFARCLFERVAKLYVVDSSAVRVCRCKAMQTNRPKRWRPSQEHVRKRTPNSCSPLKARENEHEWWPTLQVNAPSESANKDLTEGARQAVRQ